jgi:hypothetical protein
LLILRVKVKAKGLLTGFINPTPSRFGMKMKTGKGNPAAANLPPSHVCLFAVRRRAGRGRGGRHPRARGDAGAFRIVPNCSDWSELVRIVPNCPELSRIVPNCSELFRIVPSRCESARAWSRRSASRSCRWPTSGCRRRRTTNTCAPRTTRRAAPLVRLQPEEERVVAREERVVARAGGGPSPGVRNRHEAPPLHSQLELAREAWSSVKSSA